MTESAVGSVDIFYSGDGPRVAILGDSLVVQSLHALRPLLEDCSVKIAAVSGEGLSGGTLSSARGRKIMLVQSERHRDEPPAVVVIALGTNDALTPGLDLSSATAAWNQMMDDFADSTVVAVTINASSAIDGFDSVTAEGINELMRRDAHLVVDWNRWCSDDDSIGPDGLHHTVDGQHRYAAMIHEAIRRGLEGPPC